MVSIRFIQTSYLASKIQLLQYKMYPSDQGNVRICSTLVCQPIMNLNNNDYKVIHKYQSNIIQPTCYSLPVAPHSAFQCLLGLAAEAPQFAPIHFSISTYVILGFIDFLHQARNSCQSGLQLLLLKLVPCVVGLSESRYEGLYVWAGQKLLVHSENCLQSSLEFTKIYRTLLPASHIKRGQSCAATNNTLSSYNNINKMGCGSCKNKGCQLQVITKQQIRQHNVELRMPKQTGTGRILKTKATRQTFKTKRNNTFELGLESLIDTYEHGQLRRVTRKQLLASISINQEYFREIFVQQGVFVPPEPSSS